MDLSGLSAEEDIVLVGLLREVVQADGDFTDAEKKQVAEIRAALGAARFDRATAAARTQLATRDALKEAARAVTDAGSRAAIYAALQAVAASDGVSAEEHKPLRWVASWWGLPD